MVFLESSLLNYIVGSFVRGKVKCLIIISNHFVRKPMLKNLDESAVSVGTLNFNFYTDFKDDVILKFKPYAITLFLFRKKNTRK